MAGLVDRAFRVGVRAVWRLARGQHLLPIAILIAITVLVMRHVLFGGGYPAGTDMFGWLARPWYLARTGEALSLWTSSPLGEVRQYQLESTMALLIYLLRSPLLALKLMIFAGFAGGGIGMYFLSARYTRNTVGALSAAIIYMNTQYFISQWTSGHLNLALGYALAPLIFLALDRMLERPSLGRITTFSALVFALTVGIRLDLGLYYSPFMGLLVFFHLIFRGRGEEYRAFVLRTAGALFASAVLYAGLAAFVILPVMLNASPGYISATKFPLSMHEANSLEWWQTVLGRARELGYLGHLGNIWWDSHPLLSFWQYNAVMAVTVGLSIFGAFMGRNRMAHFLLAAAVLSLFLAKGPHPPLEGIYIWMYDHVPTFSDLRAPNRWLMITSLSYAFLAGTAVAFVSRKLLELTYTAISRTDRTGRPPGAAPAR